MLGTGGFGRVYQAEENSLYDETPQVCAIKVIEERPNLSRDHIRGEVRVLRQHASKLVFMPDIYYYWYTEQKDSPQKDQPEKHFIVMQFIEGHTLGEADALPWTPDKVLDFLEEVLGHLSKLHAADIIHRDIKPSNIKHSTDRGYVLLDFGLASEGEKTLIPGLTPDYAPLEQFYEKRPPQFRTGHRSDLYSLAATAYYLLTGEKPTRADLRNEGKQLLPPSRPKDIPSLLLHILAWMLEMDPNQRPSSAKDVLDLFAAGVLIQPRAWPTDRPHIAVDERALRIDPEPPRAESLPNGVTTILQPSRGRLSSIDWSPDSRYLAAGSVLGVSVYDLRSQAKPFYPCALPVQRLAFLGADTLATLTSEHIQLLKFPVGLSGDGHWQTFYERDAQYYGDWTFYAAGRENLVLIDDDALRLLPIASVAKSPTMAELVAYIAAVSVNGQVLATADTDGITIWRLEERQFIPKERIPIASDSIRALALTADGNTLAIGLSSEIWLWDVVHGRAKPEPSRLPGNVVDLDITYDGTMLAVVLEAENGHQIHLWSIAQRQLLRVLDENTTSSIARVAFAPNGSLLAGHSHDQILIWQVGNGKLEYHFDDYMDSVICVAYSPDGRWLAAMGGRVWMWHIADSDPQLLFKLTSHSSDCNGLAFSPDSNALVTACQKMIRIWDLPQGIPPASMAPGIDRVEPSMSISQGIEHGHGIVFADQDTICMMPGALDYRSRRDGKSVQQRPIPDVGLDESTTVMTPDGQQLATYSGRSVVIWRANDNHRNELPVDDDINSVAISPDGRLIAVATELSTSIWHLSDLKQRDQPRCRWALQQGATRIVFDTTGTRLALLSRHDIDVWKFSAKVPIRIARFTDHTEEVRDVAFAPSGRTLASASQDGTVRLWELAE